MDEERSLRIPKKWLEGVSKGVLSHELEAITNEGLQVLLVRKGFVRCNFVVPSRASDEAGNWHIGAMATLIDDVGATAIYTVAGHVKASVDFNISFYSTVKIHEEVEIEAKIIGNGKGMLSNVLVEVRRRKNRELIALGKQWMASHRDAMKSTKISKL